MERRDSSLGKSWGNRTAEIGAADLLDQSPYQTICIQLVIQRA